MIVDCPSCSQPNRLPVARLNEKAKCAACKAALVPLARPVAVATTAEFDELVRDAPGPVLVDFWADWWTVPDGGARDRQGRQPARR
jgi:thioredoxin 2